NLAGKETGTIEGNIRLTNVQSHQALVLDGKSNRVTISDDHNKTTQPTRAMTAEAWVRIETPRQWGGIIGAIQDNGAYERGWILGFNDRRFSLAVAGTGGPDRLTYLKAPTDFQPRKWYHVAGTYDGTTMTLFVNGKPVASSTEQSGPIKYPPQASFEIGAYHDKDEDFPLTGRLHEVRVYRRVLTPNEVAAQHQALADRFPSAAPATEAWKPLAGPWF
ncbi:MAG: LamG domain-containing protein, partial [Planctomycetota bacterium]|nr:LamG domain-containing protein [Planctomycetota bacterium]